MGRRRLGKNVDQMSKYKFHPPYAYKLGSEPFVFWNKGFTEEECDKIVEFGKQKQLSSATINVNTTDTAWRRSAINWISEKEQPWLYSKLEYIIQQLNGQYYNFDLWGFHEDLQFTIYKEENAGFYDWHVDSFSSVINNIDQRLPRKLSVVVQLSDPEDYEGGTLCVNSGRIQSAPKAKGTVIAFPSYMLHKVNPVTKGRRYSLVMWVCGPHFR